MTQEIARVLRAAADRLEKPGAWTQGVFALDADGLEMTFGNYDPDRAVCWCVNGALHAAGDNCGAQRFFVGHLDSDPIGQPWFTSSDWNDAPERTQAEVVAALRAAATLAEAR